MVLVAALALTVVAAAAGCEQPTEDAAMTNGLLVLSGDIGSVTLTVRENDGATSRDIELPDPGTAWVSAGRTNVLLATLIDGTTYVSEPLGEDDPDWRLVEPVTLLDAPPEPPLFFGTWDPPGGAYAQLGADFSEDGGMRAVIVDPGLDQAVEVSASENAVPVPAAWIDDDRVVLVASADNSGVAIIVDSAAQDWEAGPGSVRMVATSADASMAAVWEGPGQPVAVLSTEAWLAAEPANIRIEAPDGAAGPAVMALDGEGRRLAVVWTDEDGSPVSITVNAADRDWGRVASLDLGDARAATVAWLR
jgi:hypothetical protein